MPIPPGYLNATRNFEKFLVDARNESDLNTTNMAWNMVVGVLQVFRRRLDVEDAMRFSNMLPPGIRSLFVADWDLGEERRPFEDVATMTAEVKSLRAAHNFSPDSAIRDVAAALRRNVDEPAFDELLSTLSPEARAYWSVDANPDDSSDETGRERMIESEVATRGSVEPEVRD